MLCDLLVWCVLCDLCVLLNVLGLVWGVIGGVGFELVSGVVVLYLDSDFDLLLCILCLFLCDDVLCLL